MSSTERGNDLPSRVVPNKLSPESWTVVQAEIAALQQPDVLSTRVKGFMQKYDLTDRRAARFFNVGTATISKWKLGKRIPKMNYLIHIASFTASYPRVPGKGQIVEIYQISR